MFLENLSVSYPNFEHTKPFYFWKFTPQKYFPRYICKDFYCRVCVREKKYKQCNCHPQEKSPINEGPLEAEYHAVVRKMQSIRTYQLGNTLQQWTLKGGHFKEESCCRIPLGEGRWRDAETVNACVPQRAGSGQVLKGYPSGNGRRCLQSLWFAIFRIGHASLFSFAFFKQLKKTSGSIFGFLKNRKNKVHLLSHSSVPGWWGLKSSTAICTTSARSCSDIIQNKRRGASQQARIKLTQH